MMDGLSNKKINRSLDDNRWRSQGRKERINGRING